ADDPADESRDETRTFVSSTTRIGLYLSPARRLFLPHFGNGLVDREVQLVSRYARIPGLDSSHSHLENARLKGLFDELRQISFSAATFTCQELTQSGIDLFGDH